MPPRRRRQQNGDQGDNEVRGPTSALTGFLREQGINAEEIRQRWEESVAASRAEGRTHDPSFVRLRPPTQNGEHAETAAYGTNDNVEEDEEEVVDDNEEIRVFRQRAEQKRRRAQNDDDSDFEDIEDGKELDEEEAAALKEGKSYCLECDTMFKVSISSKKSEKYGKVGYLCHDCTNNFNAKERQAKKVELEARKKRKKIAQALLDKKDYKLPSLQDNCIKIVTKNIDDVELLGDIGQINLDKISKILSKNRSLNSRTMHLFLDASLTKLEFWDCSEIDSDSLNQIAAFCPNIKELTLNMCGQLHNDNLKYFGEKLTKLESLSLNGPFLISDATWQEFFRSPAGQNLKSFSVANTHRFLNDSLICLLDNCGKNLESLTLSKVDGINSQETYDLLPHFLHNLKHLEISYPHKEELVTDEMIFNLMSVNANTLESLVLDHCSALTNEFLTGAVKQFGTNLTKLHLTSLDQISDEGFCQLFDQWDENGGLMDVNLSRCFSLTDESIWKLLKHSSNTLVELNLNSLNELSTNLFKRISRNKLIFPLLTSLDIGFVRACDDKALAIISRVCPSLHIVEIYGNNRCSTLANVRPELKVIGRQSDTV